MALVIHCIQVVLGRLSHMLTSTILETARRKSILLFDLTAKPRNFQRQEGQKDKLQRRGRKGETSFEFPFRISHIPSICPSHSHRFISRRRCPCSFCDRTRRSWYKGGELSRLAAALGAVWCLLAVDVFYARQQSYQHSLRKLRILPQRRSSSIMQQDRQ